MCAAFLDAAHFLCEKNTHVKGISYDMGINERNKC
jgi:hypothetical protein